MIILKHFKMLMNGLAATMSASIILPIFDGQKNTVAPGCENKSEKWSLMGRCLFLCRNGMVIIGRETLRYSHIGTNISGHADPAHTVRLRIHRAVSLIGRWWPKLHQEVSRLSHLEFYLDEFPFNRRRPRIRSLLFYRLKKKDVGSVLVSCWP